jgi:hypothetical protein
MSTDTFTIENIVEQQEDLAKEISMRYDRAKNQRSEFEDDLKEVRDYVYATDTRNTVDGGRTHSNSTTLPHITRLYESLVAVYIDALFPQRNWVQFTSRSEEDSVQQKRRIQEAYVRTKAEAGKLKQEVIKCLHDWVLDGIAFGTLDYVKQTMKDGDGNDVLVYEGPKLERIAPQDIVFNLTGTSFQDTWKITRKLQSIGQFKRDLEVMSGDKKQRADEIFKLVNENRITLSRTGALRTEDADRSLHFVADGFGNIQEYYGSGLIEILEFRGGIYNSATGEYHANRKIVIADRLFVIQDEDIGSWNGSDYMYYSGWRKRQDNLMAQGPLLNVIGMQFRIDKLENLKADAVDEFIDPDIVIVGDVDTEYDENGRLIYRIPDGQGSVTYLRPDTTFFNADLQISNYMQLMDRMVGLTPEAVGFRTPGEKTAFEVNTLGSAQDRLVLNKVRQFEEEFLQPMLEDFIELARRNLSPAGDEIIMINPEFGHKEFLAISKEDLKAKGVLHPVGSSIFEENARVAQTLQVLLNTPGVQEHVSGVKSAKMLERVGGLEEFNVVRENVRVEELAEVQRLQRTAQAINDQQDAEAISGEEDFDAI